MTATSTERQLWGAAGSHKRWSTVVDRTAATQPMRDGFNAKFEDEVDPERMLPADVRAKLAESARKAYYLRLSAASVAARRKARELSNLADAADDALEGGYHHD